MTGVLESTQRQDLDQVSQVQARRRRIEAAVERDRPVVERGAQRAEVGAHGDQPAPGEVIKEMGGLGHARILAYRRRQRSDGLAGRRFSTCARYGETVGSPSSQKRHAVSAPADRPTRGPAEHLRRRPAIAAAHPQRTGRVARVEPVLGPSDPERDREASRATSKVARWRATTSTRQLDAFDDFARTEQHGGGGTHLVTHEVHAEVHAVGEVDVHMAGLAEHHGVARRLAAKGVRAGVEVTLVRLDLGETHGDEPLSGLVLDDAAKEVGRDDCGWAVEERALQDATRHGHAFAARSAASESPQHDTQGCDARRWRGPRQLIGDRGAQVG